MKIFLADNFLGEDVEDTINSRIMAREMTREDILPLVNLHENVFSGSLGVALGKQYLIQFFDWFISHTNTVRIVLDFDGSIAGYVFGAEDGYRTKLMKNLRRTIVLALITRPWVLLHKKFLIQLKAFATVTISKTRTKRLHTGNENDDNNSMFVLVGIGVDPQFQGMGLGNRLMAEFENLVWIKGADGIRLSVYRDNHHAQSLYQSRNWKLATRSGNSLKYTVSRHDA